MLTLPTSPELCGDHQDWRTARCAQDLHVGDHVVPAVGEALVDEPLQLALREQRLDEVDATEAPQVHLPQLEVREEPLVLRIAVGVLAVAQRVRQRRPGGGFKTKAELGILMRDFTGGPNISDDMWLRLRDDLTCFGWQDSKVILPPRTVTTGSSSSSTTTGSGSGSSGLDLTSRAPVNMNTASKEVLTACFAGLEGRIERFRRTFNGTTAALANRSGFPVTLSISFNQAANLAQKIIVRRSSGSGGSPDAARGLARATRR